MKDFFSAQRERLSVLKTRRENGPRTAPAAGRDNFEKCPACGVTTLRRELSSALRVCPKCGHHFPIGAYLRLSLLLDEHTFRELDPDIIGDDPLDFPGYADKAAAARLRCGIAEAVVTARGRVGGYPVVAAVLDSRFFMGSMGVAMGEKVVRAIEQAQTARLPLIIFCASGGARMQEGILSLMQMAKTSAALERFSKAGGLYIAYLTHPTTGGVTASFASLGDITLAEPNALVGFAGPRVIEQTIGQKLPEGFQRAEFLQEHGFADSIVPRCEMKATVTRLLALHARRLHR